ncbi:hypothetical protein [Muribaculum intestinale]|nr:hypothetical protein [Muribaculum intestinale]
MKRIIIAGGMLFFAVSHLWSASCGPIVANPINLNYKMVSHGVKQLTRS